jgi:hypothetical protein
MPNSRFTCPVCGYPDLDEPPYDKYGCSSFDICPSCGTEFGLDDKHASLSLSEMHAVLREQWASRGFPWSGSAATPPPDWAPLKQLSEAGLQLPSLRENPAKPERKSNSS